MNACLTAAVMPPARCVAKTWGLHSVLLVAAGLLLSGCATAPGGYPNRAAAPSLVQAGTSPQDNQAVYLKLVRQMQQQGAYYASLAHIEAYRLHYGDTPELQRLQADAFRETQQGTAAIPIYRKLLRGPEKAAAWHGLGLIAAADNPAQAEEYLHNAVVAAPINAAYLSDLGYLRLLTGQLDAAREPLAKSAELAPDNPKTISNLALWTLLQGHYSQADAIMQRAKLPQATRDAVRRLAVQLRTAPSSEPPGAEPTGTRRTPPQRSMATEFTGIPGNLLDRFGPPPTQTKVNQ